MREKSIYEENFSLSFTMNKKNGSGEFLFIRYNLESTGTIKEGTKACPPIPPLR
jgi:hypothetical protein